MIIASYFIAAPQLSNKDFQKDPKMVKLPTLSSSATNGPTFPDDKLKMALAYTTVTAVWPSRAIVPGGAQQARSPKNVKKPQIDVIVIDMVYFSFFCLLKLILYNSKPQKQICDWNQKCFCFVLQKS